MARTAIRPPMLRPEISAMVDVLPVIAAAEEESNFMSRGKRNTKYQLFPFRFLRSTDLDL